MNLLQFLCDMTVYYGVAMGNGPVTLPLVRKAYVEDHGVLSPDQLLYAYAGAQILPGQTVLYFASLGYMLYGPLTALLVIAIVNSSAYVIVPAAGCYSRLAQFEPVRRFTTGLNCAALGLSIAAAASLARHALHGPVTWVVALLVLFFILVLQWSPLKSVAIAATVGLIIVMCFPATVLHAKQKLHSELSFNQLSHSTRPTATSPAT